MKSVIRKHLLLFFLCAAAFCRGDTEDPFGTISIDELRNGLKVCFAPSGLARNVELEFRVLAGWESEPDENPGVALLTRQVVFRGEGGQSISDLFTQAGGRVTSGVERQRTFIRASVPSIKSSWAINELSKVLMPREISPELLETAKEEALRELGSPANAGHHISDLFAFLVQGYFVPPDFAESEFGVRQSSRPPEILRLQIRGLTITQVRDFYLRHYTPSNMVLFIAGPLKKKEMVSFVRETYGNFPDRGKTPFDPPEVVPRQSPYVRSRLAQGLSSAALGTKFSDLQPQEELAVRAYLKFLAHRLNGTLFSKFPKADRANAEIWVDPARFGYARLSFHAPIEDYSRLLHQVQDMIESEARRGEITDEEIQQTIDYYLNDLEIESESAEAMLDFANRLFTFQSTHQTEFTPFEVLQSTPINEFREHLTKLFSDDNRYSLFEEPPIFFNGESTLFYAAVLLAAFVWWRRLLRSQFQHTEIRYVRKIRYGAGMILFLAVAFSTGLWVMLQLSYLSDHILYKLTFYQSTYVLNEYVKAAIGLVLFFSFSMLFFCFLPRKMMVVGDDLVLKCLTYHQKRFPLSEIKEVYVLYPHEVVRHRLWSHVLKILHWAPWHKGLLIRFRDETGYYLNFKDADKVGAELREVMERGKKPPGVIPHHQILKQAPRS